MDRWLQKGRVQGDNVLDAAWLQDVRFRPWTPPGSLYCAGSDALFRTSLRTEAGTHLWQDGVWAVGAVECAPWTCYWTTVWVPGRTLHSELARALVGGIPGEAGPSPDARVQTASSLTSLTLIQSHKWLPLVSSFYSIKFRPGCNPVSEAILLSARTRWSFRNRDS